MIGNRYEYDAMAQCEQQMWWYRCLHDLTLEKIKSNAQVADPRILDAGCGTGGLLLYLKESGFANATGFDLSSDAVEYASSVTGSQVAQFDITDLKGAYPADHFDIITSHDIVCLLDEGKDKIAIEQLLAVLKPGGFLLMNFPALNAFNGSHDLAVGIQKRYSKAAIGKLFYNTANVKEIVYWPFLLSPAIFITRFFQKLSRPVTKKKTIVSDVKMPAAPLNNLFYKLTTLENQFLGFKPWGSSLFLVLQKPL